MIPPLALVWHAFSGAAFAAVVISLLMVLFVVFRMVREARATGSTKRIFPRHILWVGIGVFAWGVGMLDTVTDHIHSPEGLFSDGLPPEWSAAPTALFGAAFVIAGLWKMVEWQGRVYTTLGGPGTDLHKTSPVPYGRRSEDVGDDDPLVVKLSEHVRRLRVEQRVIYTVVFAGLIFGFSQTEKHTDDIERVARAGVEASRDGCERTNALRRNQVGVLRGNVSDRKRSLRNLNGLERFREQLEEAVERDEMRLRRLRRSLAGLAVKDNPYKVDCERAYPDGE